MRCTAVRRSARSLQNTDNTCFDGVDGRRLSAARGGVVVDRLGRPRPSKGDEDDNEAQGAAESSSPAPTSRPTSLETPTAASCSRCGRRPGAAASTGASAYFDLLRMRRSNLLHLKRAARRVGVVCSSGGRKSVKRRGVGATVQEAEQASAAAASAPSSREEAKSTTACRRLPSSVAVNTSASRERGRKRRRDELPPPPPPASPPGLRRTQADQSPTQCDSKAPRRAAPAGCHGSNTPPSHGASHLPRPNALSGKKKKRKTGGESISRGAASGAAERPAGRVRSSSSEASAGERRQQEASGHGDRTAAAKYYSVVGLSSAATSSAAAPPSFTGTRGPPASNRGGVSSSAAFLATDRAKNLIKRGCNSGSQFIAHVSVWDETSGDEQSIPIIAAAGALSGGVRPKQYRQALSLLEPVPARRDRYNRDYDKGKLPKNLRRKQAATKGGASQKSSLGRFNSDKGAGGEPRNRKNKDFSNDELKQLSASTSGNPRKVVGPLLDACAKKQREVGKRTPCSRAGAA